jgi:hypothetical protein
MLHGLCTFNTSHLLEFEFEFEFEIKSRHQYKDDMHLGHEISHQPCESASKHHGLLHATSIDA